MPLWAALASLFVACIAPIQHALQYHVVFVKGALSSAGNCSIPLTLIVLGAYFYPPPPDPTEEANGKALTTAKSQSSLMDSVRDMLHIKTAHRNERPKEKKRPGETATVVIAVASRMIITPLLLMPLMALSTKFDVQRVFDE